LGGLGATYDDHLRLIGKRIVDRSFFCFVTMHAFDRQSDSFLIGRPCSAVKTVGEEFK